MSLRQRNARGVTLPPEAMHILNAQRNLCALCGRNLKTRPRQRGGYFPHVDHHAHHVPPRDRIRGILCPSCNRGLGSLGDGDARTIRILARLPDYLNADPGYKQSIHALKRRSE
jgi:hypothetical protein